MGQNRTEVAKNRTIPAKQRRGRVHVNIVATTTSFALSNGLTMAQIEAITGLDGRTLGNPEARLPDDIPHRIWNALAEVTPPHAAPTLEAARAAPMSALSGIAHAAQYAATMQDALAFFVHHRGLLADRLELALSETEDETTITGHHPNDAIDRGRVSEVGMALTARLLREILGLERPPLRVEFAYGPLGPETAYRDFFGCDVRFDTGRRALVYAKSALRQPVSTADPTLFDFVTRHFALALCRIEPSDTPPDLARLRQAIEEAATVGDYRAAVVAGLAQMSLRRAQRIVAAEGTTLGKMIEDARLSHAVALLDQSSASISAVAALLGFSDERAFRRAFQRWTGQSPSAYRKAQPTRS